MSKTVTVFVSPCGNDHWSGLRPEPVADGSDGPLATPAAALAALRQLRQTGTAAGAGAVQLRAGTYYLSESLTLTPEDSGTAEAPVVISAFAGERVVLSGGRRITGWQAGEVHGRPCWTADLPEVRAGSWNFIQLFVNGERRWRPRLPKTGTYRFTGIPAETGGAADATDWDRGPTAALYREGDIQASWKNLDDVKLVVLRLWFEMHHRVRALDPATHTVQFRAKCFGPLRDEKDEFSRYFADNVFEALTEPGEWYLDRPAGRLYYLPRPGETLAETEVIAPRLAAVVRFAGSEATPVRHITLENLVFQHAEWDYPADDVGSIQAAYKVPGAIQFDHAETCALYGCEVAHVAQYGVQTMTGCHGNLIAGCWLHDLGGGGVRIDHEWMHRVNETVPALIQGRGDRQPMATTVTDCTIHDAGLIHLSAVGLFVGNAGGNRLLHNHIFDLNYTGISCGWTWGYADAATVDNQIEFNHVHHVNWQKILSDNGGIYTLGIHPGGTVKNNHVHHIACFGYGGWGLYPDEGSSEFVIENNVVHHTEHAGFSTHYGRDNQVRNNIFALAEHAHVHPGKVEAHRTTVLERNLVFWRQDRLGCGTWLTTHFLFRDNLFWNDAGPVTFDDTPLAEWQAAGQLTGTVIADPRFAAPDAGEFALAPDSPARQLGFKPVAVEQTGPRFPQGRKPPTLAAWLAVHPAAPPRPIVRSCLERLDGDRIRLTVSNVGALPASGRLRLRCWPRPKLRLTGPGRFEFAGLAPGEARSAEFAYRLDPTVTSALIETVPASPCLHPTAVLFDPVAEQLKALPPPGATVPRLPAPADHAPAAADWERAARLAPWHLLSGHTPAPNTEAHIFHDGTSLYLRLSAQVNGQALKSTTPIWSGDDWEIFVAATRARPYRQFLVAPDGRLAVLAFGAEQNDSTCGATVRSVVTATAWTAYLTLPLTHLLPGSAPAAPGGTLYLNAIRGASGRCVAWSPAFSEGNHSLARLGELRLAP
jgi:hypothetical protein